MAERRTLARPYAKALFSLAQEQDKLEQYSELLKLWSSITSDPDAADFLTNPRNDADTKLALFSLQKDDAVQKEGKKVLELLLQNDRLLLMPEIAELYHEQLSVSQGVVDAEVISAITLNETQKEMMIAALEKKLQCKVNLICVVDEAILGGAIIRAGDIVIDGSVLGKLHKLTHAVLH